MLFLLFASRVPLEKLGEFAVLSRASRNSAYIALTMSSGVS